jgi:hypothetical protein
LISAGTERKIERPSNQNLYGSGASLMLLPKKKKVQGWKNNPSGRTSG